MSVWICFQSIPVRSTLYADLHADPAFNALMAETFDYCGGAFRLVRDHPGYVEDYFDFLMEDETNPLGPEPEARRKLREFRYRMERTRLDFPGLEDRFAAFQGTYQEIHACLEKELELLQDQAAAWVDSLIFGDQELAPDLRRGSPRRHHRVGAGQVRDEGRQVGSERPAEMTLGRLP